MESPVGIVALATTRVALLQQQLAQMLDLGCRLADWPRRRRRRGRLALQPGVDL
ncbi:MAG TPA: hypothetical protein VFO07_03065 [Roseiflexaceae bacterium]|nr:hypothetical protein [Roseiflexaceae bacterium]